jgi:hypothetical protein
MAGTSRERVVTGARRLIRDRLADHLEEALDIVAAAVFDHDRFASITKEAAALALTLKVLEVRPDSLE